jgi:hypothetical protein
VIGGRDAIATNLRFATTLRSRSKRSAETDTFLPRWFLEIEVIYAKYVFEVAIIFFWCNVPAGHDIDPLKSFDVADAGRHEPWLRRRHRLFALTALVGLLVNVAFYVAARVAERIGAPATIGAGALNSTRQTGSVLGVALFGSLVGQANAFMAGSHW